MIQKLSYFILFKLCGWRMVGEVPNVDKYLFVAIPHTSNWDFVVGWLATKSLGLDVKFFVKDVFFIWPLNYLCALFGVMPVNRKRSTNFVDSVADLFSENEKLAALITPERL